MAAIVWDVFLNHRGPDLKKTFVSHLNKALCQAGCYPFLDIKSLVSGKHGWNSIKDALNGVHVHVAIFSPRYAESKHCLNELCIMLESKKPIIPVFYNIEPEHLRETNTGPFAEAFQKHLEKGRENDVERWKKTLQYVSELSGITLSACNGDTVKLEEKVVGAVLNVLLKPFHVEESNYHLVGLKEPLKQVIDILHNMGDNIGIVGICGMGGIGKTTLAREVYNHEKSNFRSRYFAKNVKNAEGVNFTNMQKEMVSQLLCMDSINLHWDTAFWFNQIQKQKIFLVIDDISEKKQIYELMPILEELATGSRVLITSRDLGILKFIMKDNLQSEIYQMSELKFLDSLNLFIKHAFHKDNIYDIDVSFQNITSQIVKACGGLPLALEVMGSFLSDKKKVPDDQIFWNEAICELKRNGDIMTSLQMSYYGLVNKDDQRMFLDIACFMLDHPKKIAMEIWESNSDHGSSTWSLRRLMDKFLVKVNNDGKLRMHDLLRDMGRNIVLQRALDNLEIESYIRDPLKVAKTLRKQEGLDKVIALSTIGGCTRLVYKAEKYEQLKRLKYLILDGCDVKGDFSKWSEELSWLRWRNMPYEELPLSLNLPGLVVLDLSESNNLTRIWAKDFNIEISYLELRVLILSNCINLKELPHHIEKLTKLKILNLKGCLQFQKILSCSKFQCLRQLNAKGTILEELPEDFGELQSLVKVNFSNCEKLKKLPNSFSKLFNLEVLSLSHCRQLEKLPLAFSKLKKLKYLNLEGTILEDLPMNFGELQSLIKINLKDCKSLKKLPCSFFKLCNLEELDLSSCGLIEELPHSFGKLKKLRELNVAETALKELPKDFGKLHNLIKANFRDCKNLTKLPHSFSQVFGLEKLHLQKNEQLQQLLPSFGELKGLKYLNMRGMPLEELPEDFGKLQSLLKVRFGNCKSLRKLPNSFSKLFNLIELNFLNCGQLQELPLFFGKLKNLKELHMSKTALQELPKDFGELQNLTKVNFRDCKNLRDLPHSFFKLFSLQELELSRCKKLIELPLFFGKLKKLRKLNVAETALKELPHDFGELESLQELNLWNCRLLQKLPHFFGELKKLRHLNMSETLLEELPEDFGGLQSLIEVDLKGCENLKTLPCSFSKLSSLEKLYLSGCKQLLELPPFFGELQSLTKVDFKYCENLKKLPDSFSKLSNLERLYLWGCRQLQELPPYFGELQKLKKLNLRETSLEELPMDFGKHQNLKKLSIGSCKFLKKLPDSFSKLSNLEELDLSKCILLKGFPHSFGKLKNLKELNIDGTGIEELPHDYCELQNLKSIYFKNCKMLCDLTSRAK